MPLGLPPGHSQVQRREALPISGAIWFRPDWMPIMVTFVTRDPFRPLEDPFRPLESACIAALAPVYAALGVCVGPEVAGRLQRQVEASSRHSPSWRSWPLRACSAGDAGVMKADGNAHQTLASEGCA